jgi:HYDIN/CFA65/VesB family protein
MRSTWTVIGGLALLALVQACSTINPARTLAPVGNLTLQPANSGYTARKIGTTSPAHMFTLTNPGSNGGPAIIESITTSDGQFTVDNTSTTCTRGTLPVGSSCRIGVTFSPGAAGPQQASLTVVDNSVNGPQTAGLRGAGVQ